MNRYAKAYMAGDVVAADEAWQDIKRFNAGIGKDYPKLKIIITLGSEGSMYGDTEKVVFQLSFKVNAVDTTAAGDTFTGYFFAQTAMGNTVEKSLKIASVASAIAVSRKGASVSIPMLNEVLAAENSFQSS